MFWMFAGIGLMVGLMLIGVWVAVAMGIAATVCFLPILGWRTFMHMGTQAWNFSGSFTLVAVPLYILMAEIISLSRLSDLAYGGMSKLLRGVPGGLLQSNIASCAVFAAVTGSSVACAATVSRVAYPLLVARGYDKAESVGSLAAGGTLGILIPPSLVMIIYGDMASQSVGRLFLAGVGPGIMLSVMFMITIGLRSSLRGSVSLESLDKGHFGLRTRLQGLLEMWPLILLIGVVMGSIYGGITTPTESAAMGVALGILLAALYRRLSWSMIRNASLNTVRVTSTIIFIVIGAQVVSLVLAWFGFGAAVRAWVETLPSPMLVLLYIWLMYIILGCLFEGISMMLLTLPFVIPVMDAAGFNPIWFGVILVILIEMAMLTPPVGLNLFVLQGVTGVSLSTAVRGSMPYVGVMMLAMILITIWPQIALWLPSTMGRP